MSKPGVEGRGLLQPEEFDIDDLDYLDSQNGHTSTTDWSRSPKNRSARWLRPRYVCFGLVAVIALLVAGVALNRGGGFKIPKIYGKPQDPSSTPKLESPGHPSETEEQEAPDQVEKPEQPESQQESGESETLNDTESDKNAEESKADKTPTGSKRPGSVFDPSELEDAHLGLQETNGTWEKPTGFKIIGLLFFGRPATVAILDCYLQKNLVKNGGWLDEVHFVVNTKDKDDIKWIDDLVKKTPEYTRFDVPEGKKGRDGYNIAWATCKKEHMYIKIDDDLVFFDDEAIPNLVYSKIKHPDSLNVVSNLINSPATGFFHYRFGAIHSYLPEVHRSETSLADGKSYGPTAWRASALPEWKGKEMTWPIAGVAAGKGDDSSHLPEDYPGGPPYKGHRWLPLPDDKKNLWRTPMAESSYDPNGPDWGSWSLGAQAHYSFLQNLENDDLQAYYYGNGKDPRREGIWDMAYHRMNINFMAIWGKDVLDNLPFPSFDDELALSVQIPEKTRRCKCCFSLRSELVLRWLTPLFQPAWSTPMPLLPILGSAVRSRCTIQIC